MSKARRPSHSFFMRVEPFVPMLLNYVHNMPDPGANMLEDYELREFFKKRSAEKWAAYTILDLFMDDLNGDGEDIILNFIMELDTILHNNASPDDVLFFNVAKYECYRILEYLYPVEEDFSDESDSNLECNGALNKVGAKAFA